MTKKLKISLVFNVIIAILVAFATICMYAGIQFLGGEGQLSTTGIAIFKFFTIESNVLMGIMSIVFACFEISLVRGKIKEIPTKIYILKHICTVGVVLTMLTTVLFLAPTAENGYFSMFRNSNFFYHFIIPTISLVTFVFFENTDKINRKYTFAGMIPMILYSIFYTINVFIHLEEGKPSAIYDWYGFVQGGAGTIAIALPVMLISTYVISYLLWYYNKRLLRA